MGRHDFNHEKRLKRQDAIVDLREAEKSDFNVKTRAQWELQTEELIQKNNVVRLAHSLSAAQAESLEKRRQRLAETLQADSIQLKKELDGLHETPVERRQRLRSRAEEMRLAKEQSMSKYVDEQLRRQFRATCDELRQAGDKELIRKCERERRQQIETKKLYIAGERLQDVQWEELSNKTRQKQLDLEHNEAEKRRARNLSTYKEIDAQIETLQKKRELERAKVAEEAAAFQEELLRDRQKEAEERQAHALKAADQRLQIAEFNKEYAAKQEALNAVQDTEPIMQWGETPKQVQEDKHKLVVDMQQYLAYRQTEAQRHRQEERELDEIRNAELLKAAHKQDLLWHKEQLAKDKLMREVIQSRRFQLLEKAEAQRRTAQAVEQSAGLAISLADGIGARRTESIANALKHQMEERRYQRETEKAARFYEAAETRIAEAEYQKRLQAEIRANAYREQDVSNPVK